MIDTKIDTKMFLDFAFKHFLDGELIFLKKYSSGDERKKLLDELGFDIGALVLHNINIQEPGPESFKQVLTSLLKTWGTELEFTVENNKIKISFTNIDNESLIWDIGIWNYFCFNLAASLSVGFLGDNFAEYVIDENNVLTVNLYLKGYEAPENFNGAEVKSEQLLAREISVFTPILSKIGSLYEQIRELEKSNAGVVEVSDMKLFKQNQELELNNIELKSQNTMLSEKNTELAFKLMDMEEELSQVKTSMDVLERMSMIENVKSDDAEELAKKRIAELESKISKTENYLETAHQELQTRILELEETKKECNNYIIEKESAETENLILKRQLKYTEDILKNSELEKDGLLKQISELENLNSQLRKNYINKNVKKSLKKDKLSDSDSDTGYYDSVYKVLTDFLGESAKMLLTKSLAKIKIDEADLGKSIEPETKEMLLSAIDKACGIMSVSKDEHDLMMSRLRLIKD